MAAHLLGDLAALGTAALAGILTGQAIERLGGSASGFTASPVMVPLGMNEGIADGEAQRRVLRGHVVRAGRWIAATALAWAAWMPVAFLGAAIMPEDTPLSRLASVITAMVVASGTVLGIARRLIGPARWGAITGGAVRVCARR